MSQEQDSPSVSWPDIVKFVRQLSHDIRNNLNAVELQSAYLAELATDTEMKEEVQRLRQMVSEVGSGLQRLTAGLSQVNATPISYQAGDFMEDLQKKVEKELPEQASKIKWDVQLKKGSLEVDPQFAQQALLELFANAFQHEKNISSIAVKAHSENDRFIFELHEPKTNFQLRTENWGREPFRNVSQGHYGLGLNRVRSIVEAHGGELRAEFDRKSSTLKTTVTLPLQKS
jgi:K+-sensing histidine kinase KdpD